MPKSPAEHVAEFLLDFLPGLLPKPADSVVQSAIVTFKETLGEFLKQPRVRRQLLEAAQGAESDFRARAREKFPNDEIIQAVASFPLFDRELFQAALRSLPERLHEDYLADHLKQYIADDWKGEFTPAELREAAALYLNCLRVRLLKVDGYADLVARLAILRTDERAEQILAIVRELLELMQKQTVKDSTISTKVQLVIDGDINNFDEERKDDLVSVLAALLKIDKKEIRVLRVISGSIVIELNLPEDAEKKLHDLYKKNPKLRQLRIKNVFSINIIPPPVSDFTGRAKELETLKTSFKNGAVITALSGGGGVGKTELARKLSQELADDYPAARLEIDLRGASENPLTPEDAMRRLLEPFYPNQKLPDDPNQLRGLYQQTFAEHQSLLLLDNAADAAQVRPLIPPRPSAAIVTSRRYFSLSEFGMSEPLRLEALAEEEARDLLRAASPKLRNAPADEVKQLAALCGRLPLALRVAAALLEDRPDWRPADLLAHLADERSRLKRLKRDSDPDLDLEAVLALSYALLDEDLQFKFRQLGVFPAPFFKISASFIWGLDDDSNTTALLDRLISHSLLHMLPSPLSSPLLSNTLGGGIVYSLHDLTRYFALALLEKDPVEAHQTILRHAEHFLEVASAANDLYEKGGEHILPALGAFRFLYPHLSAAFARLSAQPADPAADRWLSDFPDRCAYLLDLHLPPRERIPLLEAALAASRRLGDKGREGVYLGSLGLAYADLGDARKAIEFYEQALAIAREIGDRRGEGAVLGGLGLAYADLGDARKAIEFHEQALAIAREIGDRRGEGNWLGNLGRVYAALGDARKAIEFHEQALAIAREIGDRRGEGAVLGGLGLAYAALGDARKAIEFYEQALAIAREIGDRRGEGAVLGGLGLAYADLGDARKAIEFYEKRMEIAREIGDRRGEGATLASMGAAYKTLGEKDKARALWGQALAIFRAIESPHARTVESWLAGLDGE
jgi:tetratricopeptide (TPR) repeat protein